MVVANDAFCHGGDKKLTVTVTIEKDPIVSDFRYGDEIIVKNTKMKKLGGKLILLSPKWKFDKRLKRNLFHDNF